MNQINENYPQNIYTSTTTISMSPPRLRILDKYIPKNHNYYSSIQLKYNYPVVAFSKVGFLEI